MYMYSTCRYTLIIAFNMGFFSIIQPVQEVYDDRAAVSRKQELIQTVLTDVKTHEVTMETNLADMLESRYTTDESANNNKETKRITREGGKLLK